MWSEDTDNGDVATLRGTAECFVRRADAARSTQERERFLGYAKLYQEMAEQIESAEDDDDEP
ncbi:MAG TPA: hypothetical protein VN823_17540 [Stellaceae bacterium]|nr:hypothetical protein [Stellaceae bacterium]